MIIEPERLVFEGTPDQYLNRMRNELLQFERHIENCQAKAYSSSQTIQLGSDMYMLYLGGVPQVLRAGDRIDPSFFSSSVH